MTQVLYVDVVLAYHRWSDITGNHNIDDFYKFVGARTFGKTGIGAGATCKVSELTAHRIQMLKGPNAYTMIKVWEAQQDA